MRPFLVVALFCAAGAAFADVDAGAVVDGDVVDGEVVADADAAAAGAAAAPAVPAIPVPDEEPGLGPTSTGEMLLPFAKTMLMLGVVLVIVWLTLSKGMGKLVEKAQAGKRVKVIERIALDARRSLFLVDVDGKQILLASGDVVQIASVDAKGASTSKPVPSGFVQLLSRDSASSASSASASSASSASGSSSTTPTASQTSTESA
jgi:flagellar biogenesis protein FliO